MPRTVDEGFRDFLATLAPSATESAAAKSHRASIEACLKSNFSITRFVRIGSFGNGTSISGYSDVDYLASIPTSHLLQNSGSSLTKVRNALDTRFPNTGVRVSCPAVTIPFGTIPSERTEVVPADFQGEVNNLLVYEIADCSGGWRKASPDAHNAYVDYIDGKLQGKVKPLIRYIKAWKYFLNAPISSFYLEMYVAKYSAGENSIVYYIDIARIFCALWTADLPSIQDPMGVSGLIAPCKSTAFHEDAMSKLLTAKVRAEFAQGEATKGNIKDAFSWWRM